MTAIERYHHVQHQVSQATLAAGRERSEVKLMVVSKTWEVVDIQPIVDQGQLIYGENRVLEASNKISLLPSTLEWHLIGHLQTNKVRKALPLFHTIHSVDSMALACQLSRIAQELQLVTRVCLQVNIGNEPQKHGFTAEELDAAMPELLGLAGLQIAGLMAIPPQVEVAELARPYFRDLRLLRDRLQDTYQHPLEELSMGMTSDFHVAIEEGATIVRVGSAIFGERS